MASASTMFLKAAPENIDVLSKADGLFEPGKDFCDGVASPSRLDLIGDSTRVGNVTPSFCCCVLGFYAGCGSLAIARETFVYMV